MAQPTMFSAVDAGWTKEDWTIARNERAGILEHDEKLARPRAEQLATAQTYARYGACPK